MIQFLKRHGPLSSAMFSPVDPNQLTCAEVDGVFVVDIRKPKRFVIFFVIVNWKQLRLFWTVTWFIFFYLNSVFCTIYLPIKKLVVSDTITMAVVCCVHQFNVRLFTTLAPTRNLTKLTGFPFHNRQHCTAVALPERKTNLSSRLKTAICSSGNCHHQAVAVNEL